MDYGEPQRSSKPEVQVVLALKKEGNSCQSKWWKPVSVAHEFHTTAKLHPQKCSSFMGWWQSGHKLQLLNRDRMDGWMDGQSFIDSLIHFLFSVEEWRSCGGAGVHPSGHWRATTPTSGRSFQNTFLSPSVWTETRENPHSVDLNPRPYWEAYWHSLH